MSVDYIEVAVSAVGGKVESKIQNISRMTFFSDLLVSCSGQLENIDTIVNKEERIVYVVGDEIGSSDKISAIVDEDYNIADICFNQKLFITTPKIHFVFDYFKIDFIFYSAATKPYTCHCSLQFLCGSKAFGKEVLRGMSTTKENIPWTAKLREDDYTRQCDTGMKSEKIGLKSENCVVFIVHPQPSTPIKNDAFIFLDSVALQSKTAACPLVVLFRQADYLRDQLKDFVSDPLIDDTLYLLMFRMLQKPAKNEASTRSSSSSVTTLIVENNSSSSNSNVSPISGGATVNGM